MFWMQTDLLLLSLGYIFLILQRNCNTFQSEKDMENIALSSCPLSVAQYFNLPTTVNVLMLKEKKT